MWRLAPDRLLRCSTMPLTLTTKSDLIKNRARALGFDRCGIVEAEFLVEEKERFIEWLDKGYHGEMAYMANNVDKRLDPRLLVENTKSIVVVALNYYPESGQADPEAPVLSKYAYGTDYHFVVKDKLNALLNYINDEIEPTPGRAFVDSAPILEHAWARKAGLGWIGKHSLLMNRELGSFMFLGELLIDLPLAYDAAEYPDFCGGCNRCITACPTGAIVADRVVDGSKCISYFTIELKDDLPQEMAGQFENRVFGCDICQDVCPWNQAISPHGTRELLPNANVLGLSADEWHAMDAEQFRRLFKHSAVKRTKFRGLKRNLAFLST